VLFGSIVGQIDEPGIHILLFRLGWRALFVNWIGRRYVLDMKMDQEYLRSQTVNSEEGAPMGIGIWYEMYISNSVSYIFKNSDPRGSLAANVGNSTVRSLSNMPLDKMMSDRHSMSQVVRLEVVGETLREISQDPEGTEAMFDILELTRIMKANIPIEYVPARQDMLDQLLVSH